MQFRPISNKFDEPRKGRKSARAQTDSMISEIIALKEARATYGVAELAIELSGALSGHIEMLVSQMRIHSTRVPKVLVQNPVESMGKCLSNLRHFERLFFFFLRARLTVEY